eukprot:Rhum_TRINITY_DN11037_c0_g2::Rhum_TRINITY_DN11037_c0_g2_i1::g.41730::m.41730
MHITASYCGASVDVEVDEGCRTLSGLKGAIGAAMPELEPESLCLEVAGRCIDGDDAVCALEDGCVVAVAPTTAARAAADLRAEGCAVNLVGFLAAAAENNVRRCGLYLDAGVAPSPWSGAVGPLHSAAGRGCADVCKLLLDRVDRRLLLSSRDADKQTPVHWAAANENGGVAVCRLLLDYGLEADCQDDDGWTPLHLAANEGNVALVKLLLDRGCSTKCHNGSGCTPLNTGALGQLDVCELLLDSGSDVNTACIFGSTPLHRAASAGCLDVCALLLRRGAALNSLDASICTPLHCAAAEGHTRVCRLLLDHGCDAEGKNDEEMTPAQCAEDEGHQEVVELLTEHLARSRSKRARME